MKKVGILIFAVALMIGVSVANIFDFGRIGGIFNISFNDTVTGSGSVATERRDVADFSGVKANGVFEVEIAARGSFGVEVEADDNLLPLIRTEVKGDTLVLELAERVSTHNRIRVLISAPNIESVDANGASKVNLRGVNNESLTVDSSGVSKIILEGKTEELIVDVSGASCVDAENLRAENASIDASGASHVSVRALRELRADASGASKITYFGTPANLVRNMSGASSISQK